MKVAVLMGGTSPESQVSLKSGRAVAEALRRVGHEVWDVVVEREEEDYLRAHIPSDVDLVFIAMHGGAGEDGRVQELLEGMGLAYTGSGPQASRMAMDKVLSRRRFSEAGLPQPEFVVWEKGKDNPSPEFGLPWVVKPSSAGSSIGLSLVREEEELLPALERAYEISAQVLVEEYIKGVEITVGIVGDRAFEVVEVVPVHSQVFDYRSKYTHGETEYIIPARISEEDRALAKETARKAFSSLGCRDFGRVDMIFAEEGPVVLEVNTIPGMTELSLLPMACRYEGIGFEVLCQRICELALKRSEG